MRKDIGLLILRLGIGGMFVFHGLPKLMGGPDTWQWLGGAMGVYGITFAPKFWGFMAAASECVGGLCLISGALFMPACVLMAFTMFMAASMHISQGDGIQKASHAIELCIVFFSLIFIGAGGLTIGGLFRRK